MVAIASLICACAAWIAWLMLRKPTYKLIWQRICPECWEELDNNHNGECPACECDVNKFPKLYQIKK